MAQVVRDDYDTASYGSPAWIEAEQRYGHGAMARGQTEMMTESGPMPLEPGTTVATEVKTGKVEYSPLPPLLGYMRRGKYVSRIFGKLTSYNNSMPRPAGRRIFIILMVYVLSCIPLKQIDAKELHLVTVGIIYKGASGDTSHFIVNCSNNSTLCTSKINIKIYDITYTYNINMLLKNFVLFCSLEPSQDFSNKYYPELTPNYKIGPVLFLDSDGNGTADMSVRFAPPSGKISPDFPTIRDLTIRKVDPEIGILSITVTTDYSKP